MKGSSEAKKSKGALALIAFGAPRSSSKASEPDEDAGVDPSEAAFTSFAEAAGIDEASRPRARAALKQFVYSCMSAKESPEEEDEEAY